MNEQETVSEHSTEKGVFHAPWEKFFDKILTPFEEFVHRKTASGLLLPPFIMKWFCGRYGDRLQTTVHG